MNGFEHWFSLRLRLRSGVPSSTSTGVVIAITGVALALMVMELSLAIVTGFKSEIRRKVMGFSAQVSVTAPYDVETGHSYATFFPSDTLMSIISGELPAQARAVKSITRQAIIKTDSDFAAVEMVARDAGHDFTFERANITSGILPQWAADAERDSVVISEDLASRLRLNTGDRPFLYFFVNGDVKARRATIAGLYKSNFTEYDAAIAYAPPRMLSRLSGDEQISSVDVEGLDESEIEAFTDRLQSRLVDDYRAGAIPTLHPISNVYRTGALYFNWLELLDTNVVVIFILMLCVAALTLISSLFIVILDRVPTIGVLRALGAPRKAVSGIFLNVAMRLVGAGLVIGNILGLGLALLQSVTHLVPLDPAMYYLDYVPVKINWWAMLALNVGVIISAWLILILPARLASRIDPASTMRYE